MSLAVVYSRAQLGIHAPLITVEVHLSNGLPGLSIVGLPETAVKESKDRVRSAILNSHFEFPQRRITINLAPADLPKEGGRYDLPIALGILAASGQIPLESLSQHEFIGELALTGELRAVTGSLPAAIACSSEQRALLLPSDNANEAAFVKKTSVLAANHLLEVCAHLNGRQIIIPHQFITQNTTTQHCLDLCDVRGQESAKRALEIAAAGNHNLLMIGSPGTGKTMLASRMPGILPPLTEKETLQVAAIRSIANRSTHPTNITNGVRPFRSPHHTASAVALIGGGSTPRPGEISLAHNGVLFLDELPEFQRKALEVMREPLESGEIIISRASAQMMFPARFQLIAAMNPCPCGYFGDREGRCRCSADQVRRYRDRISGPLLDRIDLHINVPSLKKGELQQLRSGENSSVVRERVLACRKLQWQRNSGKTNNQLDSLGIEQHCRLGRTEQQLMEKAMEKLQLSARAYHRILKVSRTIADLSCEEIITQKHIAEALSYRQLDRTIRREPVQA
jgi:magnesium chelatase family protein